MIRRLGMILFFTHAVMTSTATGAEVHAELGRNAGPDDAWWERVGAEFTTYAKQAPDGLMVDFPKGADQPEPTGIALRSAVRGDFEITAAYEILQLEHPEEGHGSGIGLMIQTEAPERKGLTLERFDVTGAGSTFTSTAMTHSDGSWDFNPKRVKTTATSGSLRISRKGSIVRASFTEGSGEYRELRELDFGDGDLTLVRFAADNGRTSHALKVLLKDLVVRADAFPKVGNVARSSEWRRIAVFVMVTVVVPILLFLVLRSGGKLPEPSAETPA